MNIFVILALYAAFRAKQFICDFLLQADWMALNKGKPGREGYQALALHAACHAMGTFIIVMVFMPSLWWLAVVDFCIHGLIDRIKGLITYKKGWNPKDRWFWWSFGLDQEAHNFTHLAYIVLIIMQKGLVNL